MNTTKMIEIHCENNNSKKKYPVGTTLLEILKEQDLENGSPFLGAMVNNVLKELTYCIYKPKTVKFFDYKDAGGKRMYVRSLSMVLFRAVHLLYPNYNLRIEHSVSGGYYCELEGLKCSSDEVGVIKSKMQEIIDEDIAFMRDEIKTEEALERFAEFGLDDKCLLLNTRVKLYTSVYKLKDTIDYYYGHLVPSTKYLRNFDLVKYHCGMLMVIPSSENPDKLEKIIEQPKLFEIFREYQNWADILGVPNVGQLNELTLSGEIGDVIKIAEALQEKKLSHIADSIFSKRDNVKLILVSGPSSSGKTTFAKRLSIQLRVLGMKPILISLDNYFVDRPKTPLDENGEYDFESPHALDIKLFNENMLSLLNGESVKMPKFSFSDGSRYYSDKELNLVKENIIIVEGIHGLNPEISSFIPPEKKYKVYVSALTQLGIDSHNRIPTTDSRLIRRMVRDYLYRDYSAYDTIKRWPSVRAGEEKHIFPYQEEADVMFNTALLFELGILKRWAEPILQEVPKNVPEYSEAKRLLKFLSYFVPIPEIEIPPTSILREFLEGSSFDYS